MSGLGYDMLQRDKWNFGEASDIFINQHSCQAQRERESNIFIDQHSVLGPKIVHCITLYWTEQANNCNSAINHTIAVLY